MVATSENGPVTNRILLVEGQDDKHLVWQLCQRDELLFLAKRYGDGGYDFSVTLLAQSTTFRVLEKGSRIELLDAIRQEVRVRGRQAVGIVVDADNDFGKGWDEVVERLSRAEVQLPSSPDPAGTIIPEQDDKPRVGIWLMPDNKSQGELEDFVLGMIPYSDTIWPLSESYVADIPESDRKFRTVKTDKAKLYAWLAARREPGRMGAAVGAGDLEVTSPLCQNFLIWLTRLFG